MITVGTTETEEAEEQAENELLMIEMQNFLNKNNATFMILLRLSDPSFSYKDSLFQEFIKFAIRLLEGGNNEVQKNVYKYFCNFTSSEVFFLKVIFVVTKIYISNQRQFTCSFTKGSHLRHSS